MIGVVAKEKKNVFRMQRRLDFTAHQTRERRERIGFFNRFDRFAQNPFLIVLLAEKSFVNPLAQAETVEQNKSDREENENVKIGRVAQQNFIERSRRVRGDVPDDS